MNFKFLSLFNIFLAVGLSWVLFFCEESGMVILLCCYIFLVFDVFCGLGLFNFWGFSDDEKIFRFNKFFLYKFLDFENKCKKSKKKIKLECLINLNGIFNNN